VTGSSSPTVEGQETPTHGGPFAPLGRATFRSLWVAGLASNIGDWMENVGSAWLMTELSRSATLVGLVQTSSSLPFVLFVLPAGALADIVDRRKLLLVTQVMATVVLVILAILTALGGMTPALLLLFTFAIGTLAAAAGPSWQAIVPDLVPRDELRSAVALNSASVNVARAVGPAIAGLLITIVGVAAVYAGNALAFLLVVVLVARWKAPQRARVASPERLAGATRAGIRYARASLELRAVLYRTALFAVPASAIWALLPIVVRLRFGDDGGLAYGILLALLGGGAIVGILVMPRLQADLSIDRLIGGGSVLMAAILVIIGVVPWPPVLAVAAVAGGVAWVTVVTNVSAAAQFRLPDWVRARGLGAFQMVFQSALAFGGLLWGVAAEVLGVEAAMAMAGGLAILGVPLGRHWSLEASERLDLEPAALWPEPEVDPVTDPEAGPVEIQVTYRIDPADSHAFLEATDELGRQRRRDGAYRWLIAEDAGEPGRFVETFFVETWAEHLRQHRRVTEHDRATEERVLSFQLPSVPIVVEHLIAR